MTEQELRKIREICQPINKLISAQRIAVAAYSDGRVMTSSGNGYSTYAGSNLTFGTKDWSDIVAVATGNRFIVGVLSDGLVISTGDNKYGQCNVSQWRNIVDITCGRNHTVGLRADGTVVATGKNDDFQCNVEHLRNVVSITAGQWYTAALHKDGTVSICGPKEMQIAVKNWHSIVAISGSATHLVGVQSNGTCVLHVEQSSMQEDSSVRLWKDIISVATYDNLTVGLCADGTVRLSYPTWMKTNLETPIWTEIVAVEVGSTHDYGDFIMGVKADGTVVWSGIPGGKSEIPINSSYLKLYSQKLQYQDWKLFDNFEKFSSECFQKRAQRKRHLQEIAQIEFEKERQRKKYLYEKRIAVLTDELQQEKGFFKAGKRRTLRQEIEQLQHVLNKLK